MSEPFETPQKAPEVSPTQGDLPDIPDWHKDELDRRLAEEEESPEAGSAWAEVKARLLSEPYIGTTMPNGRDQELPHIQATSRFWGVVWQIGDAAYYFPIFAMFLGGPMAVAWPYGRFGWSTEYLKLAGTMLGVLIALFPIGFCTCVVLQGLARRRTGVKPW
jgi:hypothetical protein